MLLTLFLGGLLAYIFYPLYSWGKKKLKKETLVALLICLLVLILIIFPLLFFVKGLINESYSLYLLGKQRFSKGFFEGCSNYFCEKIKELSQNPEVNYWFQEGLKRITNGVIKKASSFLVSLPYFVLNLFVMLFALFYFLKGGSFLKEELNFYLNLHRKKYSYLVKRLGEIIHAIVYGYLLIALMQGLLGALGFFIFGVSSPLFWGMVMAFLALIPFLGTGMVWGPAALILLLEGLSQNTNLLVYKGIGLFFYGLIIISSLDNLLKPKIIGEKAKVHPLLVLVGIFGGILLMGPLGVIIGPLVLSLTAVIIEEYLKIKNVQS